jgi:hypothetical protein
MDRVNPDRGYLYWHDNDQIEVAQYQLTSLDAARKKLVQFPRGTAFTLDVSPLQPDVATRVTSELVKAADAQGITFSRK